MQALCLAVLLGLPHRAKFAQYVTIQRVWGHLETLNSLKKHLVLCVTKLKYFNSIQYKIILA
jgi:hypothetical protein